MKCLFEVKTICRLCLRVSEKVYRLNNKHHKAFIESIIKIKQFQHVPTDDEYICYICNALLRKSFNFMQTVWNAQEIICVVLKNTDKITKPMIECIDRHNNGLNYVNLSSVVICDNVNFDSSDDSNASTDIEESDIEIISSSSDEDRDLDKCNLDEAEVEIDIIKTDKNNLDEVEIEMDDVKTEISDDVKIEISDDDKPEISDDDKTEISDDDKTEISDDDKTEISDPLTKDFNTDAHDVPKPEHKKKIGIAKRITLYKEKPGVKAGKRKNKVEKDDDYHPDSTSHSEDSDIDSYDDTGKRIKRPKEERVYPRKCDHCDYEVLKGLDHYRHYLNSHPNTEYPYKRERNFICSVCGKLCTKYTIGSHEATHDTQKLKCNLCPNVYSNKIKLYRHTQNVHPKRKLTCDYCSKTFKTRNCITRHIRTHTGSKPFKCHICGAGFAHSGNRSIHIRSKHQNYKCVPKKPKRGQKVRKNKKYNSTDTENTSSNEKTIRRTKRKTKTKML